MAAFTTRPATAADQQTISRMIGEAGLNRMGLKWPRFIVVEEAGSILGIGQVKPHRDGTLELASLAVVTGRS
jgi:N-acetylglutamate synthase-like GNAT family acetyltransferase